MILDKALSLLSAMGIDTLGCTDYISLCVQSVEEYVKNYCAISTIPDELLDCCAQMVCGKVLKKMLSDGSLDDLDYSQAVKSVTEGDVSIAFDSSSSKNQMLASIADSMADKSSILTCFRKLRW